MTIWRPRLEPRGKPLYLEIAERIQGDVRAGVLKPGDRLPPQRRLAEALGIDFTTVSRGYAEARARGLVESHVGRGTFVAAAPMPARVPADPRRAGAVDLSMNLPPEPTDPALLDRMRAGLEAVSADLPALLRYQSATGGEADRAAAALWLAGRGLTPGPDRIAVTPGAHATMVAVLGLLAAPGEAILSEDVTYPGLRGIAAQMGLRLIGLASDGDGILPDALALAIAAHGPRALYLNPTLNNPTTRTIPAARRQEIAEVLNAARLPLIEDDAYGFIPVAAPPPIAARAPGLTWHIGGLAKCIGAGLRLAYTVAPDARAAVLLAQAIRTGTVMPSPLCMALATRWIEDGTADGIRRFLRAETAARQAMAENLLAGHRFAADPLAFNLWLDLPEGLGRAELVGRMAGRRIGILASDAFTLAGPVAERVRVCLGGPMTREELRGELLHLMHMLDPAAWRG